MFGIMGAVEQCHGGVQNWLPDIRMLIQLSEIFELKIRPFPGIASEPLSELIARAGLLHPGIVRNVGRFQTARPQTIHEKAGTVARIVFFIHTLQLDC